MFCQLYSKNLFLRLIFPAPVDILLLISDLMKWECELKVTRLALEIVVVQPTHSHSKRKTRNSLNKRYHEKTSL